MRMWVLRVVEVRHVGGVQRRSLTSTMRGRRSSFKVNLLRWNGIAGGKKVDAKDVRGADWDPASGGSDSLDNMPSVALGTTQDADRLFFWGQMRNLMITAQVPNQVSRMCAMLVDLPPPLQLLSRPHLLHLCLFRCRPHPPFGKNCLPHQAPQL